MEPIRCTFLLRVYCMSGFLLAQAPAQRLAAKTKECMIEDLQTHIALSKIEDSIDGGIIILEARDALE